ncbi:flavodoxin domain-containing protein [Romboutsia sp.]|uniref:flavodoxin domain-containing protein n=1 Tax=Romboutsia sp. TaxID=1965302 RepID=UPI003F2D62E5
MSKIVIYESRYGSTEMYANWIGEVLNCKVIKREKAKIEDLLDFDTIIYGGWLHAGFIKGFKLISKDIDKLNNKNIVAFSVGCSSGKEEEIKSVEKMNFENIGDVKYFYLRGAFNYQKLNIADKILMSMMKTKLKNIKEEDRDEDTKGMLDAYINPIDFTDKNNIKPLIEYVNSLS